MLQIAPAKRPSIFQVQQSRWLRGGAAAAAAREAQSMAGAIGGAGAGAPCLPCPATPLTPNWMHQPHPQGSLHASHPSRAHPQPLPLAAWKGEESRGKTPADSDADDMVDEEEDRTAPPTYATAVEPRAKHDGHAPCVCFLPPTRGTPSVHP